MPSFKNASGLFERFLATGKVPAILAGMGLYIKDYTTGESLPNTLWTDLGYAPQDMVSDLWLDLVHPEDRPGVEASWAAIMENTSDYFDTNYRIRNAFGAWVSIHNRTLVLERTPEGVPSLVVGIDTGHSEESQRLAREVAEHQEVERRYLEAESLLLAHAITASTLASDEILERILVQCQTVLGFDATVVWRLEGASLVPAGHMGFYPEVRGPALDPELARSALQGLLPFQLLGKDALPCAGVECSARLLAPLLARGEPVGVLECLVAAQREPDPRAFRRLVQFGDIASVALSNAWQHRSMEERALTDWLSGVGTRRKFEDVGGACLRASPGPWACMMVDIDHFKRVNDQFGHAEGDKVIRAVGQCLHSLLREGDLVCRYGGEEFVVLAPWDSDAEAVFRRAETLRLAVAAIRPMGADGLTLTASVGLALYTPVDRRHHIGLGTLVDTADRAMYQAKLAGRNRVVSLPVPEGAGQPLRAPAPDA